MRRILAITGGVGGAKLALGLAKLLPPDAVQFVVNTGDDFEHLGLAISPDIDTLTYTLAEENNTELGWGRQGETWQFLEALKTFGGETWFQLGDKDLALHTYRTERLKAGATLTEVTSEIAAALRIEHTILPMSDDPVRTIVFTEDTELAFQHYFVRDRCAPAVTGFEFRGAADAAISKALRKALDECTGVIVCPSNPFVSVDPILAVPGMREALQALPVVAVSPIVGGIAIKGPTAKMMAELNIPATATEVANHYGDLIDTFIIDETDEALHGTLPVSTVVAQSVMVTLQDRINLAQIALDALP